MRQHIACVALIAAAIPLLGTVPALSQAQSAPPQKSAPQAEPPIKGLVFLPRAEDLVAKGVPAPAGQIDASRVPALAAPAAQEELRRYLGLPLRQAMLDSLRAAVGKYYQSINRPFVSVAIPKQDVTDGVVQVVVIEGRLGKLGVTGNRWFDDAQYLDAVRLQPGGPIDNAELQSDLDWINDNPYRHATVAASAGTKTGDTDLTLQAQDRFPFSVTAGIDNTGNASTGLYRAWTVLDWGNALWRGDDFNYRFTTNPEDPRLLKQHTLSYTSYLPWRDTLNLSGSIVDSDTRGASLVETAGHNDYASLRYQHALPGFAVRGVGALTQTLTLGYDFKSTNNNILFGGISVFPSTTEVDQFLAIYGASLPDAWGSTHVTVTLVASPGGLTQLNNTATFQTQQAGARADYFYGNGALERLTNLPYGATWDAKAIYQRSNGILLSSEQLSFGGPYANRGFVTAGATRDEGFQTTHELRAPSIQPNIPARLGAPGWQDQFVPFVFFDYGIGWNHPPPGTSNDSWLSEMTIGPGFTYQLERYLTMRFTYGVPLQRVGFTGDTLRSQFSVTLTY
jgi:hemolysin activation/secretion protein